MRRQASALLLASCVWSHSFPVSAQGVEGLSVTQQQALLVHLREAREAYEQGDYERALISYDSAYRIESLPSIWFFRAQCFERLERDDEAIEAYERFLSLAPQDDRAELVTNTLDALRKAREARLQVTLYIDTRPSGAGVRWRIDGEERRGVSPVSVQARAGEVLLFDVEHEGYMSTSREFAFAQGSTLIWEPTLQPLAEPVKQVAAPERDRSVLGWSLGVGAASGLLLSTGGFIVAARSQRQLDAADALRGQDGSTRPGNYDALQTRYNWGVGLGWAGALGAVTCAGLAILWRPWASTQARTWYLTPSMTIRREAGVSVLRTF